MKPRSTTQYYLKAWRNKKSSGLVILSLATLAVLSGNVAVPFFISRLIEQFSLYGEGLSTDVLWGTVWALFTCSIIAFFSWRIFGFIFVKRQAMTLRDLEQMVYKRLIQHSYSFFANKFAGSIVSQTRRFVNAYEALEDAFMFELFTTTIRLFVFTGILLWKLPPVGIALFVWSVFYILTVSIAQAKKMPLSRAAEAQDSKVTAQLADTIGNVLSIKASAKGPFENKNFKNVTNSRYKKRVKSWIRDEWIRTYQHLTMMLFQMLFIVMSTYLIINNQATVASVILAQFYVFNMFDNLFGLSRTIRTIEREYSAATEMTEILNTPLEIQDLENPYEFSVPEGEISFEKVTFAYEDTTKPVFRSFNLTINSGTKVGLVGHSGSGKTTLVKLLLRFVDIDGGSIQIDDQDIRLVRQDDLRGNIAYVSQEPMLFHRTIKENIAYSKPEASMEEIIAAAKKAQAHQFIKDLDKGYDTMVGERGVKLSGGEKQRVAIARAMLSPAPILLLDEATSALDSKSEKLITKALDELMKNRTTIVIAHRLSTIRKLDRILVMSKGKVVEDGSHEELSKADGQYAELWSHQSGDFLED